MLGNEKLLYSMTQAEWTLCASRSIQNGSPIKPQPPLRNIPLLRSCEIQTTLTLQLIISVLLVLQALRHYQLSWSYLGHACIVASTK